MLLLFIVIVVVGKISLVVVHETDDDSIPKRDFYTCTPVFYAGRMFRQKIAGVVVVWRERSERSAHRLINT